MIFSRRPFITADGRPLAAHPPRVLLLAPSEGLGGGIERYLGTVETLLESGGAVVRRVDLRGPGTPIGPAARLRFTVTALRTASRAGPFGAVLTGHPSLIPVAAAAATVARARRGPVIFHGIDIWGRRRIGKAILARHPAMYPVAVSSFSAGALAGAGVLAGSGVAPVLHPGIAPAWRAALLESGIDRPHRTAAPIPTLLSVFRLNFAEWEGKGLRELLAALPEVRRRVGPVRLVIAGRGPANESLRQVIAGHEDVELLESPDDATLARLYGTADLFALCTRTRPPHSGEGYGIVLIEAQLAGCPVVAPASGGSRDAYVEGLTGTSPADESPEALAAVLTDLLTDRDRLARLGRAAAEWARTATNPDEHMKAVFTAVLGIPRPTSDSAPAWRDGQAEAVPPMPPARPEAEATLGYRTTSLVGDA